MTMKLFDRYNLIWPLLSLLFLFSCEKSTRWNLHPSAEQKLVVDGIITDELKTQVIRLSLSFSGQNDSISYPDNAEVSVFDGTDTFRFEKDPLDPGTYRSETEFAGVINKTYSLEVKYDQITYTAETNMLPVAVSIDLSYTPNADSSLYSIPQEIAQFNPDESSMYEVRLDWSAVPGYENLTESQNNALLYYYVLTTIDVNQIFAPAYDIVFFPAGTLIDIRKYSLAPEHEAFIRSVLLETQWHGSNFDTEEGNAYTNISNGGLGFFGACSVVTWQGVVE
jgi:hypothetical protein